MLKERINDDIKTAMKAKDAATLETLRMIKAEIGKKEMTKPEITDEDVQGILKTYAKQQEEGRENFVKGGRQDLADKAIVEIALVKKYLPAEMPESEIESIVKAKIAETGATAKDFGKLIGSVMKEVAGRAEGSTVTAVIKKMIQ